MTDEEKEIKKSRDAYWPIAFEEAAQRLRTAWTTPNVKETDFPIVAARQRLRDVELKYSEYLREAARPDFFKPQ